MINTITTSLWQTRFEGFFCSHVDPLVVKFFSLGNFTCYCSMIKQFVFDFTLSFCQKACPASLSFVLPWKRKVTFNSVCGFQVEVCFLPKTDHIVLLPHTRWVLSWLISRKSPPQEKTDVSQEIEWDGVKHWKHGTY